MFLKLIDVPVLYFDFNDFVVEVLNEGLLPISLRGRLIKALSPKDLLRNVELLKSWLSNRVLSLSRDNAKQIYAMFGIPQLNSIDVRVQICLKCHGVSIQDSYWLAEDENEKFELFNIRKRHFKEILDVSLLGYNPTVCSDSLNPELTTHGLFKKCWIREKGSLYLLKSDKHPKNINTRMEVLASQMLDCFANKISCVHYEAVNINGLYVSKCRNFVGESYSFVEAWEVMEYCKFRQLDFKKFLLNLSKEASSIAVLDYVLANTDRHTQNYGFWVCNKTGKLRGVAPLFDFNYALVSDYFGRNVEDTLSQMFSTNQTLLEVALEFRPYCNMKVDYERLRSIRGSQNVLERCRRISLI